jgi:hypothetical protein
MLVSSFNLSQSFNYTPYLFYKKRSKSEIISFCTVYGPRSAEYRMKPPGMVAGMDMDMPKASYTDRTRMKGQSWHASLSTIGLGGALLQQMRASRVAIDRQSQRPKRQQIDVDLSLHEIALLQRRGVSQIPARRPLKTGRLCTIIRSARHSLHFCA